MKSLQVEQLERRLVLTNLLAGFSETLITTKADLARPTAMEFSPTGQLWVLEQGGRAKLVNLGTGGVTTAGNLSVQSSGERGLLGIAFDQEYDGAGPNPDNVYLYYTASAPSTHNRLSRFVVNNAGSAAPTLGEETIIMEVAAEPQGDGSSNHNGGAIHFGRDGNLYIAIGDHNADGSSFRGADHVSQRLDFQHGKLLRIDVGGDGFPGDPSRNYAIPGDNPFIDSDPSTFDEIWALGLRNPYTFAVQPGSGRIFINDVGEGQWEEINDGTAGANYGWASEGTPGGFAEGFETAAPDYATVGSYENPIMAYDHSNSAPTPFGCAITGGAFYPANSQFGAEFSGTYFFADFCGDYIRAFNPSDPGSRTTPDLSTSFADDLAGRSPVDLKVDGTGSLYYLARGAPGAIYRISFDAPTISAHPDDLTVDQGQSATFSVIANGGAPLILQWQTAKAATPTQFVDLPGANSPDLTLDGVQPAANGDRFRVVVTNSAGAATSNVARLSVNVVNQPPTILNNPAHRLVNLGQSATFEVTTSGSTPLSHQWQRADVGTPSDYVDIAGATDSIFTIASADGGDNGDMFRVVVTNAFGSATSEAASLIVNQLPTASIDSDSTYRFGDTVSFSATATDAEDGALAASAFSWTVDFAHREHFHPHVAAFGDTSGAEFIADFVEPDPNQFYRIILAVTDSLGAVSTSSFDVLPVTVNLTLATVPEGISLAIDGQEVGELIPSVVGSTRAIQAPPGEKLSGVSYRFESWSDGGSATHDITTPATDATLTAHFVPTRFGDVRITQDDRRVRVQGDAGDNKIRVLRAGPGLLRISGLNGTLVNGAAESILVAAAKRRLVIRTRAGEDSVILGSLNRNLNISTGEGDDLVRLRSIRGGGNVSVQTGVGSDRISAIDAVFSGRVNLASGGDGDVIVFARSQFLKQVTIATQQDADRLSIDDTVFQQAFSANTGAGTDTVELERSVGDRDDSAVFRGAFRLVTGGGVDTIRVGDAAGNSIVALARVVFHGGAELDTLDAGLLADPNAFGNLFSKRPRVLAIENLLS